MKKEKSSLKKEDEKMMKWILDYFCEVILPICKISGYKVFVKINRKGDEEKTFSIEVNFPYRSITLYIRRGGITYYKGGDIQAMREVLFHEAFHIIHWKYKEYAEARFVDPATLKEFEEDIADRFSIIVDALYRQKNVQQKKRRKKGK